MLGLIFQKRKRKKAKEEYVLHGAFSISESFSGIRGQRAGTQTKSDSLGSVPSTMASFTEKCRTVFGHVGGVQKLIAHG